MTDVNNCPNPDSIIINNKKICYNSQNGDSFTKNLDGTYKYKLTTSSGTCFNNYYNGNSNSNKYNGSIIDDCKYNLFNNVLNNNTYYGGRSNNSIIVNPENDNPNNLNSIWTNTSNSIESLVLNLDKKDKSNHIGLPSNMNSSTKNDDKWTAEKKLNDSLGISLS